MKKVCTICQAELVLDAFSPSGKGKYGVQGQCRACRNRRRLQREAERAGKPIERPQGQGTSKTAHLVRVPKCICTTPGFVSASCEVHFACQIDKEHNRTPAAINYTDI